MNYFIYNIKKHASLLVIIVGAFSFFIANIINKELFTPSEYGYYSVFITYLSVINLFGILGLEQNLLRFSFKNKDYIETQKIQFQLFYGVSIINAILSSVLFINFYSEVKIYFLILLLASYGMISQLFLSNLFRINTNFVVSQLASNLWKIQLLLLSIVFFIYKLQNIEILILLISLSIITVFIFTKFCVKKFVKIKYINNIDNKSLYTSAFHFFISIFLFTILIFADRFIIEKKFSIEEFGNYFYLTNFFLAPFSIIQNYIGFKQLIHFKYNFSMPEFNKINLRNVVLGFVLAGLLFIISLILPQLNLITFDFKKYFNEIIIILLIGIARLFSSSVLSGFEAQADIKSLRKANIYIVVLTFMWLVIAYRIGYSLFSILYCFLFVWIFRAFIHLFVLSRQLKTKKNETHIK